MLIFFVSGFYVITAKCFVSVVYCKTLARDEMSWVDFGISYSFCNQRRGVIMFLGIKTTENVIRHLTESSTLFLVISPCYDSSFSPLNVAFLFQTVSQCVNVYKFLYFLIMRGFGLTEVILAQGLCQRDNVSGLWIQVWTKTSKFGIVNRQLWPL